MSISDVKRELQVAIVATYQNPNAAPSAVPRKGEVPMPEEFIEYAARKMCDTDD